MIIKQIYTGSPLKNYSYLIGNDQLEFYCLDPFDGHAMFEAIEQYGGTLKAIINTHEHDDHTCGNLALLQLTGCQSVYGHPECQDIIPGFTQGLKAGDQLALDADYCLEVMETPGHSRGHICLKLNKAQQAQAVFSGDILFNAGVGHCRKGGNVELLYKTLAEQFHTLSDEVLVYPGHEYMENNLGFTISREPSNETAKKWLARAATTDWFKHPLVTTIGDERQINTFFRLGNDELKDHLPNPCTTDKDVFIALRSLRDQW